MITSKNISVVLQGPIDQINTPKAIESIRKYLPKSEIIISTWEKEDTEGLLADKIVYNKDPGCSYDDRAYKRAFNINRWIVSSKNGVANATRKYVLKGRTDIEIVNTNFLGYWNKYAEREDKYIVVSHKILIPSPYTLRYLGDEKKLSRISTPFHVSDWYCFGLKNDIFMFVDCPVIENLKQFARHYEKKMYLVPYNKLWWMNDWLRKMAPEQYIGLSLAKRKFKDIDIEDVFTFSNIDDEFAEKFLLNNFIVLDPIQYGIVLNKYREFSQNIYTLGNSLWKGMYRNYIYEKEYLKYFENRKIRKIDIQNIYHNFYPIKLKIKNIKNKCEVKAHRIVDKHPFLHAITFTLLHVKRGEKIYKKLKKNYPGVEKILVCPYRGTGDSYIIGNYLKQSKSTDKYLLTVPRNLNKKILKMFDVNKVEVLNENENKYLQEFEKIMHMKDMRIFHYASEYEQSNVGYNLAGYKGLNFADFYDYIVFGETKPILYHRIESHIKNVDYEKKYGIVKGSTVLIAPYSDSIDSLQKDDWEYLVKKLRQKGYCVLTNCGNSNEKPIKGSNAICVGFDEVYDLAEWCGYFISVRSGLCDILSTCTCRKIILYPKYIKYKYGRYIDFFTLSIPERNLKSDEYEYERNENRKVVNKILATL
jgi:hypothetical protein